MEVDLDNMCHMMLMKMMIMTMTIMIIIMMMMINDDYSSNSVNLQARTSIGRVN